MKNFIVLEGIDGSGKGTQLNLFKKHLNSDACLFLSFPDYDSFIGELINDFLHQKINYEVKDVELLLFFADILQWKNEINQAVRENKLIISDRYITSTLVYQGIENKDNFDRLLTLIDLFKLPLPEKVFYLDITPEESFKRKTHEKEELDRNESNLFFLEKARKGYLKMSQENILCEWEKINGMQSAQEVFQTIFKKVF